jgi:alpha-amylase
MKKLPHKSSQKKLALYFQIHQPMRLRRFKFFDIGMGAPYFDDTLNNQIIERVARECYLPANTLLLKLIKKHPQIRITFSISGLALDQFHEVTPEVLDSFRALGETGCVEFLGETQYHSLASLIPGNEFESQVIEHSAKLKAYLGLRPTVFRNTELIYSNDIASRASALGFNGIFCDGIEQVLGSRSPHHLYAHPKDHIRILLRNYRLSDDIAFRFEHNETALTVDKYMSWLRAIPNDQSLVNIAMDYETFGEHQKKETGIFTFLENLLIQLAKEKSICMMTPSEVIASEKCHDSLSVPGLVSWADRERDVSAWLGNAIQQDAFDTLLSLEPMIVKINDPLLLKCWRMLQTSDHFYYMSTKKGDDGVVHSYFSPYPSPYEAFINYMNVLSDLTLKLKKRVKALQAAPATDKSAIGIVG